MCKSPLLTARVQSLHYEAEGIISVELRPLGDTQFPAFEAGAHIDLHLANGLVRSYSLLNAPSDPGRYQVGILRDRNSRGGSEYVHSQLRVGMTLSISAPRNNFQLDLSAPHSVLVAGGIGITPIYCMFRQLLALGKSAELIYCARTRQEAALVVAIDGLEGSVRYHFNDEQGLPPDLGDYLTDYPGDTHFYCCGPTPMLDAFESTCERLGYAHGHVERFVALETVASDDALSHYRVELKKSGRTLEVQAGLSLLEVLLEAGCDIDHSCREGVCGSCETRVLEGEIDHRDGVLTKAERAANRSMMVCVSGCKSQRLVLDL
ncbi:PDR/VanB family oxidoreductase [Pseudomonas sp. Fl4BN1]|uniref:PDR/VanB family oxidoreductase n=1 Tax=Pseudomonas sp. Fl4BN1 TaxID=2697651 RepID=UPI001376BEFE|nr:PDR/VanB family oxidoreductase [Pseudomonas sp. Fl4BN1]NBF13206.1 2Fe-2S iron-sulfur cluster binding domain-containing protein [Pseudomonas sp. Fl4BN1]